jgi:hypothetical protein
MILREGTGGKSQRLDLEQLLVLRKRRDGIGPN